MTRYRERDIQAAVLDLATRAGWVAYHTFDSRRSAAGFPDLVIVRGDRMLAIELKVGARPVTPAQRNWLEAFAAVRRVEAFVFRSPPDDAVPVDYDDLVKALR